MRNYRLHREATIEFDPSRTLISGPNEVGKTTLIEAIHRGLFLKARGASEVHRLMKSTLHADNPEVEVSFKAGASEYTVRKLFRGQNGTILLSKVGGQSWQGDDAEEKLAALLGIEDTTGRTTASRTDERWAHLWVWQGKSGDDPADHAAAQQTELLQQLQQTGGTVAMQSELDGKVANRFARARGEIFVQSGNARAGSDLDRAQTELGNAETLYSEASNRLEKLQQAITDYETAEATLQRTATDLEKLRKQSHALNEKISKAEGLQQVEREQKGVVETASQSLKSLEMTEESIVKLRKSISGLQAVLKPKQEEVVRAESRIAELRKRSGEVESEYQSAQTSSRDVRLRRELAAAYVSVHEKRERLEEIQKRFDRVRALQGEIAAFRGRVSALPEIDREELEELRTIEGALGQAKAALSAMAADIEIVSADQVIQIGDQSIEEGGNRKIDETTDVYVGDSVRLRIYPGGGNSLSEARENVRTLDVRLQRALDQHGVESTGRALDVVAAREDLQGKIARIEATLEELGAGEVEEFQTKAKDELTAVEAEVTRRLENVQDLDAPDSISAAKTMQDAQVESVREAEANESSLKVARDTLHDDVTHLNEQLKAFREEIADDQRALTGFEAQLALLLENHGKDTTRGEAIEIAGKTLTDAKQELAKTQKLVEELQPDQLASDRERLERSINEANRQREEAQTAKAVSHSVLRSDGIDDPKASLAHARARLNAAQEHHQSVTTKTSAIALLDDLFQEQQKALADRLSQPLANKITGYLQCLFGPDARAVVAFEDNRFTAIELVRSSQVGAIPFGVLSGGTREQVAAAVRLAIAELLAAEHDGSLPVVFDDAFAYSDPERIESLQRMLDLGAERGLQIIVLTCNHSDYAGLGARECRLERVSF